MTRAEIQSFFPPVLSPLTGVDTSPPHFGAASYAVPSLAWLQGEFWKFFKYRLWSENLDRWAVRFECRDFARAYASAALECWALTIGGTTDDGLAVGEMWYVPSVEKPGVAHALSPVFTENGLQFIEPQTGQACTLTPDQLSSRYFLRF